MCHVANTGNVHFFFHAPQYAGYFLICLSFYANGEFVHDSGRVFMIEGPLASYGRFTTLSIQMRHHHSHEFSSFLFNRSQRPECGFLALRQSFHLRNVHPLVGPVTSQSVQALAGLQIPEVDHSINAATGNGFPIRVEGHRPDSISVTLQGLEALTAAHLPQYHLLNPATTGKGPSIGTEGHRPDFIGRSLESVEALTAAHLPHTHRPITTAAGKGLSIKSECHRSDCLGVTLEGVKACAAARIPHTYRPIFIAAGKGLPIGAERDGFYSIGVALQGVEAPTSTHVP